MDNIILLSMCLAMIWILSGLFSAFLMRTVDSKKGKNPKTGYWMKGRGFSDIFLVIIAAPLSLLLCFFVLLDYNNLD